MRILHICLASTYADGYAYQENMITKYHKALGHDVFILTSLFTFDEKGKGKYLKESKTYKNEHDIEVTRLEYLKNNRFCRKLRYYKGTYEAVEKFAPDIIFIHNVQFMDIFKVIKYLKKHPNVKVFADSHVDFLNSATNWVSKNILHKIIWKKCAKAIEPFVSKFYGVLPARVDFLKDVYGLPKEKVELLVMGADDEKVKGAKESDARERIREKYGVSGDEFLIITGGKIDRNKPETLHLMRAVENMDENIKLMVFGSVSNELKDEFEKLIKSDKIIYIGWIDSTKVYEYFQAADLGVFPGKHSVLWEQAVGCGLVCMFRKLKGFDHVDIGNSCIFIDDVSEDALLESIEKIYNDKNLYASMQSILKDKGMKEFSYMEIARKSII